MILAIDVHYREEFAKAVSIEFENWNDKSPTKINESFIRNVEEYISGEFYKRELPCIIKILEKTNTKKLDIIIIDGFVVLDDTGKAGLGKYLYETLNREIPIIGVAKRGFVNNEKNVLKIKRGKSEKPLYITSIGFDLNEAATKIKNMTGEFRIPDLLRILDRKTKEKKDIEHNK